MFIHFVGYYARTVHVYMWTIYNVNVCTLYSVFHPSFNGARFVACSLMDITTIPGR